MNVNKININQSDSTYYIASDIYDVSYHNKGITFSSLSALLSAENLSTLIPTEVRCGGMTIRFVQSSDNKYMQYRLMTSEWSLVESDWQKVEDFTIKSAHTNSADLDIIDNRGFSIAKFDKGHLKTINFDSSDIHKENFNDDFANSLLYATPTFIKTQSDLDIVDKNGFVVAKYKNGIHLTKHPAPYLKSDADYDFAIRDTVYNRLLELSDGHIRTKNFDSRNISINAFGHDWPGYFSYSDMIPVTVKKDGTGDFTTIQEAINSITDASPIKQYDIQVYDDFYCYDTTELWKMNNITQHATANPTSYAVYILTKDYVHIRGIGEQKTIYVESPLDLAGASFANVHNLYARGKCIINNFNFVIKGGRYASHGDDSGNQTNGSNAFATQYIVNCRFEHKGNYMYPNGSAWRSVHASADVCLSSGCHRILINDTFIAPYNPIYGHNGAYHKYPSELTMINCVSINNSGGIASMLMYDIGCGHKTELEIINCNFNAFLCSFDKILSTSPNRGVLDKSTNGGFRIHGYGNKLAPCIDVFEDCWYFKAKSNNSNVEIIGGTAFNDIWLETQKLYKGATNAPGLSVSSARICGSRADNVKNYAYTLAYRLGNCATVHKTLIVKVDDTEYTITFNKNYMTQDGGNYTNQTVPYIDDADIIADINTVASSIFESGLGLPYPNKDSYDDCKEIGLNISSDVLLPGDAVKRDIFNTNRWMKAGSGDKVMGIVAERIDGSYDDSGVTKYNEGLILKIEKNLFDTSFIGTPSGNVGTMYKVGNNGWEVTTVESEAQMICVSSTTGNLLKAIN